MPPHDAEPVLPLSSHQHSASTDTTASTAAGADPRAEHHYPPHARTDSLASSYDSEATAFLAHSRSHSRSRSPSASPPPYKGTLLAALDPLAHARKAPWRHAHTHSPRFRRRCLALVGALLAAAAVLTLGLFYVLSSERWGGVVQEVDVGAADGVGGLADKGVKAPEAEPEPPVPEWSEYVVGEPTEKFRDNLRNDTQYITAWINAGWTNDVMTYANLIYLGLLSNRVPVIAPFAPSHLGGDAGFVHVGDVIDLPRLAALIRHPVLEWRDVKAPAADDAPRDALGCWSIWATADEANKWPRGSPIDWKLKLDIAYTPVPAFAVLYPEYHNDPHTSFWSLAALTFPDGRRHANLPAAAPFPGGASGHTALPDAHLACFDFPYYVSALFTFEYQYDFSPAWRFVATHMHWTPRLTNIAYDYLRRHFGLAPDAELPPFIALHIRHGDFASQCWAAQDVQECFAPLATYATRVAEVRAELRARRGVEVRAEHVLVTSDERDPAWWAQVAALGWGWVDHDVERTAEVYGKWYTVFVDAAIQSMAHGFVGTTGSTMSLLAQRRVEDWNGGVAREVKWGWKDADAH